MVIRQISSSKALNLQLTVGFIYEDVFYYVDHEIIIESQKNLNEEIDLLPFGFWLASTSLVDRRQLLTYHWSAVLAILNILLLPL